MDCLVGPNSIQEPPTRAGWLGHMSINIVTSTAAAGLEVGVLHYGLQLQLTHGEAGSGVMNYPSTRLMEGSISSGLFGKTIFAWGAASRTRLIKRSHQCRCSPLVNTAQQHLVHREGSKGV